jgi:hypothetical protein
VAGSREQAYPLVAAAACALHLLLVLRHGGLYARHRSCIQLLQRLLRLVPRLLLLLWPSSMHPFLSARVPWSRGCQWALATVLLAPGLTMAMACFNFSLPFTQHLLLWAPQLALDVAVVAPVLRCAIHRARLEAAAAPICQAVDYAARLLFGLAPWPEPPPPLLSGDNLLWALPLFALVGFGTLLPLFGVYVLEASQKVQQLQAWGLLQPGVRLWPKDARTWALLGMQLYTALLATLCFSVAWPVAMGWTVEGQCRRRAG